MYSRRILLLGSLVLYSGLSDAQQAPRIIGMLLPWKASEAREASDVLVQEMLALGYPKARLSIVWRNADGDGSRMQAMADELVRLKVDLIIAAGTNAVVAARRASPTIPIVFFVVADPVASGLAESLARPGRNNTGLTNFSAGELGRKRLELLRQLMPDIARVAFLTNPVTLTGNIEQSVREAEERDGFRGLVVRASTLQELGTAFQAMTAFHAQVVFVQIDPFFGDVQVEIAKLLLRNHLASVFQYSGPVEAGGLMSYGASGDDNLRRVASYVDKVLRGEKASNIPIQQPMKMEFVINRKTADALGLKIPPVLLLQADRVVE